MRLMTDSAKYEIRYDCGVVVNLIGVVMRVTRWN
jgi:hypothetical protein